MHPCIPGHVLTTFASFKISNTYFKDMAGDFLGYFFLDKRPIYNYSGKFVVYIFESLIQKCILLENVRVF